MIRHVVLFALQDHLSPQEKRDIIQKIQAAFTLLPQEINVLNKIQIYENLNPVEKYDFILTAELSELAHVEQYALHPKHKTLVETLIKPYLKERACVDYSEG